MREIYNEGRVVGLSAYEIYVRHTLSQFPDQPVMTEKEWIASTLGDGVSMILKLSIGTTAGIHDYPLPANSSLCAAKTITASLFTGQIEVETSGVWGTKVTSYGPLISNTSNSSPNTPGNNTSLVPHTNLDDWDRYSLHMLKEYTKVIDGVVYHPGTWVDSGSTPAKDFKPDLHSTSIVRLRLSKTLEQDLYIMLTGFLHRPIVAGLHMFDSSPVDSPKPYNGDYLGPEVYPWASKIVFTVPSEVFNAINTKAYVRQLPTGQQSISIDTHSVIDLSTTDPNAYYRSKFTDSTIPLNVDDINVIGSGVATLGTYQLHSDYPPALYGAKVTETGEQTMAPIDIVAPGSMKMFEDKDLAVNYPKVVPNVYAVYEDKGDIFIIDKNTEEDDLIPITTKVKVENFGTTSSPKYAATTVARDENGQSAEISAVSLLGSDGQKLSTDGNKTTLIQSLDNLNWTTLLRALGNDEKIELLGESLRTFRSNLPNIVSGSNGVLDIKGSGQSKIAGSLAINGTSGGANAITDDAEFKFNKPVKSGATYITLSNGLRFYVSATKPTDTDVPVGSIGVGWVE